MALRWLAFLSIPICCPKLRPEIETLDNSVKALLVALRDVDDINNVAVDSFRRSSFNLNEVQFQVGSNLIDIFSGQGGGSQLFVELQKVLEFTNNTGISPSNWLSTAFILALNLTIINDPSFLSGYSSRGSIKVKLQYNSIPPTNGISYYSYCLHDIVITASAANGTSVLY